MDMKENNMLKFAKANAKLAELEKLIGKKVYSLSLLAGISCPCANECLSKVIIVKNKRKIEDGPNTKYRCFSASQEALFPKVYDSRKHNFDLLRSKKTVKELVELINSSIPKDAEVIRIHVSGDFYSQIYFDAWLKVCELNPKINFYAYTKSLPFVIKRLTVIPKNLVLTASRGGKRDDLIDKYKLIEATVIYHPDEAKGRDIDHNDFLAFNSKNRKSYTLLIHGSQPSNSDAAKAISKLKANGIKFSYNRKNSV